MKSVCAAILVLGVAVVSIAVFSIPAQAATAPADLGATVLRIQNTCFAAYPPELMAAMSGKPGPPPADVLESPALQKKYLRTEGLEERGLFYPSSLDDILDGVTAAVKPGTRFLDLGSGDGRVVFLAAVLGAEATGIEYDRRLYDVARTALDRLTAVVPRERVRLKHGDFLRADWSAYDVIFYFGSGTFAEDRMFTKLAREMKPDAVLLLEHGPKPPPGFEPVFERGVVRAWRREPPETAGEPAPR